MTRKKITDNGVRRDKYLKAICDYIPTNKEKL